MKRIEYFCRNIRHDELIEEQMEEAKKGGIIKSYTLTTLSAMNERRNADICLWCDEIWSAGHLHSCWYVPDHNCVFTCGVDFEVFSFVKVSKKGLKPMLVKESQDEVHIPGKTNLFDEVCEPNSCVSPVAELVCDAPKVFDEFPEPNLCFVSASIVEVFVAQKVFDEISEHVLNSNQLEAPLIDDESHTRLKNNGGFDVSDSLTDCVSTENLQVLNGHHTFVKMPQANSSLSSDQIVRVVMIGDDQSLLDDINKVQPAIHGVREPKLDEIVPDYVRTAHNLFHKMPVPDFILEMAQAARITQENEEMGDAHQMFDKIPEPTEQAYASQTICQVAMINNENKPSKVLDELPHPHSPFLHAPILDVVVANEGLNIIRQRDDLNEHNDHVKLRALDHPNFTHLVDIFSNGAWLCIPSPLDIKAGLILGLMPQYKVTLHAGCSLFQVTTKPFFPCTDTKNEVLWCQKNMALEGVCTMMSGSIFSCVFVFDPVVLLLHMNFAEIHLYMQYCVGVINEWKPQVNYKEIHSWGKLLVGLIWTEGLKNTFQLPSIHNIDAYCLLPSAIRHHILMNVTSNYHGHADMWSVYFRNLNSARLQVLSLPKFILCVIATVGVLTSDMSKLIFNPGGPIKTVDNEFNQLRFILFVLQTIEKSSNLEKCSLMLHVGTCIPQVNLVSMLDVASSIRVMVSEFEITDGLDMTRIINDLGGFNAIIVSGNCCVWGMHGWIFCNLMVSATLENSIWVGGCVFLAVGNTILGSISEPHRVTHAVFSTLEDKGDFRGGEDTSKKCSSELLNPLVLWSNMSGENKTIVLLTYVFDPGGLNCQCAKSAMRAEHAPNSMLGKIWNKPRYVSFQRLDFNSSLIEYEGAYCLLYGNDLKIIINQSTKHANMIRFYLQCPSSYKLVMGHFLLGFAHLCFNIVCCNFLGRMAMVLCATICMELREALYRVWVTTDLIQGFGDMLREYTLEQFGHGMTDSFQLFDNTSILTVMIWVENNLASSYKFIMGTTFSFVIFDPGGIDDSLKGETWRTRSVTYEVAKVRTMLKWEVDMLLENGKHNPSDTTFVFDPGGIGGMRGINNIMFYCVTQVSLLQKCQYIFTLADIIWVFDPDGIRRFNDCRHWIGSLKCNSTQIVNSSKPTFLKIMLGCRSRMFAFTLADKGDLKGWELIHTENIMEGSLVI